MVVNLDQLRRIGYEVSVEKHRGSGDELLHVWTEQRASNMVTDFVSEVSREKLLSGIEHDLLLSSIHTELAKLDLLRVSR